MTRSKNSSPARLGALGETVDDELPPPVDLELQVVRRRRRERGRRGVGRRSAIAAAIVAARRRRSRSCTERPGQRHAPDRDVVDDAPRPCTTRCSRERSCCRRAAASSISLDATGTPERDDGRRSSTATSRTRARPTITAQLWYLSLKKGANACGDVVRADIDGQTSTIVDARGRVRREPRRLPARALRRGRPRARSVRARRAPPRDGRLVVLDLAHSTSSEVPVGDVEQRALVAGRFVPAHHRLPGAGMRRPPRRRPRRARCAAARVGGSGPVPVRRAVRRDRDEHRVRPRRSVRARGARKPRTGRRPR